MNEVVNGKQMTMPQHIDNVKVSQEEMEVPEDFADCSRQIDDEEEIGVMEANHETRHDFFLD